MLVAQVGSAPRPWCPQLPGQWEPNVQAHFLSSFKKFSVQNKKPKGKEKLILLTKTKGPALINCALMDEIGSAETL